MVNFCSDFNPDRPQVDDDVTVDAERENTARAILKDHWPLSRDKYTVNGAIILMREAGLFDATDAETIASLRAALEEAQAKITAAVKYVPLLASPGSRADLLAILEGKK